MHMCRNILRMGKYAFYAVHRGFKTGVFTTWDDCQKQIKGYKSARFKGFNLLNDAENFVKNGSNVESNCTNASTLCTNAPVAKRQKLSTPLAIASCSSQSVKTSISEDFNNSTCKAEFPLSVNNGPANTSSNKLDFTKGSDGVIEVYTDGACTCNGQNGALAGVGVYWGPNHLWNYSAPLHGRQTNSRAELHAIIIAVRQAKANGIKKLRVYSDSVFCIKALNDWINRWRQNNWKKTDGKEVVNKDDFIKLDTLLTDICIDWVHVRGHQGIPGNEAADKLATEGITKKKRFADSRN